MRHITLQEVNEMGDHEKIPCITGVVSEVYKRKSGTNKYGDWSFQDAVLTGDNTTVKLKIQNRAEFKPFKGHCVIIACTKDDKGSPQGVEKVVEEWNGQKYPKALVTEKAEVAFFQEDEGKAEEDNVPMKHNEAGESLEGVAHAKRHIMQSINLYNLCLDAVKACVNCPTDEMFQSAVATIYIEASRAGLVREMPKTPIKKEEEKEVPF